MNRFKVITSIGLILAILAALSSQPVLAGGGSPHPPGPRRPHLIGQIISIEDQTLVLETQRGPLSVQTNEETAYRDSYGEPASFADLQTGVWVRAGLLLLEESELPLAREVFIFPEGFNPAEVELRLRGRITKVMGNHFSLVTLQGEEMNVWVVESTIFIGKIRGLKDVEEGMAVLAGVDQTEDGRLDAQALFFRVPLVRMAGRVISVDEGGGTFVLETRQGKEVMVRVDEKTYFRSPGGGVKGLADLEPGMPALVLAQPDQAEGQFRAIGVGAADELPRFEVRARGLITEVGENSFSIATPGGSSLTFEVNNKTRYLSRGGQVKELADLTPELPVGVGGVEMEDGRLAAKVVLVILNRSR